MNKILCQHCGYKWETKSEMMFVSCPSCLQKNKVKKKEVKQNV